MIFISSVDELPSQDERVVDEHVPVSFRSYKGLLGSKYLRIGNFHTTLLELLLDPSSYTVRGVTLLTFDKVYMPSDSPPIPELIGLPVLELHKSGLDALMQEGKRGEVPCEMLVGLASDYLEVDLFGIRRANRKIVSGRTHFFLDNDGLVGIRFIQLNAEENSILQKHMTIASQNK